jgi:hypothetical protein
MSKAIAVANDRQLKGEWRGKEALMTTTVSQGGAMDELLPSPEALGGARARVAKAQVAVANDR